MDARERNDAIIDRMKAAGTIRSPEIERAFRNIPRHPFLPEKTLEEVYVDDAVVTHLDPLSGMAISSSSQPSVMALMLEWLQVRPGMNVLEIGAGTGYNAALLAELAGETGQVCTLDVEAAFCEEARAHLKAAGGIQPQVVCADGWHGYSQAAPFDRILVTAHADDIAPPWLDQLREGGLLVLPWGPLPGTQFGLTFRKEGGRLVQVASSYLGFMALRGAYGPRSQSENTDGWKWEGRITTEEAAWLSRLPTEAAWERSCPLPENLTEGLFQLALRFFIAVQTPRVVQGLRPVKRTWRPISQGPGTEAAEAAPAEAYQLEMRFGLADPANGSVCFLETGPPGKLIGWGGEEMAKEMESLVQQWLDLGQPGPERMRLTAYPAGHAPTPQAGERLIARRWFTYRVTWE